MKKGINMPPNVTIASQGIFKACITYGDELEITFREAGFFGAGPSGVFTPDLPIRFCHAGETIKGFNAPKTDKDLILCFFDFGANFGLYIVDLQVRVECEEKRSRKKR
jgi:hypothetical protein